MFNFLEGLIGTVGTADDDASLMNNGGGEGGRVGILMMIGMSLLVIIGSWFVVSLYKLVRNIAKLSHVPGTYQFMFSPVRIPILAPLFYMGNWEKMYQAIDKYGDKKGSLRVSYRAGNTFSTHNKEILKEIFITKAGSFDKPEFLYDMFNLIDVNILSALTTETWKKHHKIASPAFSADNLEYMCEEAVACTDLMMKLLWEKRLKRDGNLTLDDNDFSSITLEVLGRAGFGLSFGVFDENDETGKKFRDSVEKIINIGILVRRFAPNTFLYHLILKLTGVEKAISFVNDILDRHIGERKKEADENFDNFSKRDILSLLVKANTMEKLLTDSELKSDSLIFTLAGEETTSTTLSWIIYHLSKNKEVQEKARAEVNKLHPNQEKPTAESFEKLEYINAVVMETLRVNPAVLSVLKISNKDVQLGEYKIPKGTFIEGHIYASHRQWPEALVFNPERFMDQEVRAKSQHDFSYLPFSSGIRKCIGYKFASMEACIVVARLLQFYKFDLLNDEKNGDVIIPSIGVTVRPLNLKVKITPLNQ